MRCMGTGAVKEVVGMQPEDTTESKGRLGPEIVVVEEVEDVAYNEWLENIGKDWRAKVEATSEATSTYWYVQQKKGLVHLRSC